LLAPGGKKLPALGRARLIGVDAPIATTPEGQAATRFVVQRLLGHRVTVEIGDQLPLDERSRNLVYIRQSGTRTFNEVLLYRGLAALRTGINKRFADALSVAELYAKQRGIGLWQHCPEPRFTN
jgi:endonuclease YncB( thermonuclease family)